MEILSIEERFRAYAKVRCHKYGSGYRAMMVLKNISKSGARLNLITTASQFLKGDILRLVVELDSVNRNHVVNAEVVWSKEGALGVSFLSSKHEIMTKLLNREVTSLR